MDCAARKKIIKEAKSFPEVEKVLQEAKLGRTGMELARTAYQIREVQPTVANHFLDTIIREIEEKDEKEKKVQEYENGQSEQASNRADPLPELGKKTPDGAEPDTGATGTENQMKEDIMGQMDPSIAHQMMPAQMPPMNLPQQIKQMQYTLKRELAPVLKEIQSLRAENNRLKEAMSALDNKVQETVTNQSRSVTLDINPRGGSKIRETTSMELHVSSKGTEDTRQEISELNRMMNNGEINSQDIYQ